MAGQSTTQVEYTDPVTNTIYFDRTMVIGPGDATADADHFLGQVRELQFYTRVLGWQEI